MRLYTAYLLTQTSQKYIFKSCHEINCMAAELSQGNGSGIYLVSKGRECWYNHILDKKPNELQPSAVLRNEYGLIGHAIQTTAFIVPFPSEIGEKILEETYAALAANKQANGVILENVILQEFGSTESSSEGRIQLIHVVPEAASLEPYTPPKVAEVPAVV